MPTLNTGLELFANWQTVVLGLVIYTMSFTARRVVETGWVSSKKNKWWNEVILPLLPVIFGVLLALLAKKFPWPMPVLGSFSAKAMYGISCGVFCSWSYGRIRSFMKAGQDEKAVAADKDAQPEIPVDALKPNVVPAPEDPKP